MVVIGTCKMVGNLPPFLQLNPSASVSKLSSLVILYRENRRKFSFGTMADRRIFSLSQVAQHKSNKDCWLVINGRVLNVTKFLEEHPGGEEVLTDLAGKDATKEFDAVGHSKAAQNLLLKYQVGVVQGYTVQEVDSKDVTFKESNKREMSAFVIKEDAVPKSHDFFEFLVPVLIASFYFGYRYLTRADYIAY